MLQRKRSERLAVAATPRLGARVIKSEENIESGTA
jgi:hypothetical protein